MQLDGAYILITGAGSGIGRALAIALSHKGARPILLGRTAAALEQTRAALKDPQVARILCADLADPATRAEIPARLASFTVRLDAVINNAGVVSAGLLTAQTEDDWRKMLEVNLLAPMALTRSLLPLLKVSGQGRVVNIGSMFGDIAFPCFAAYSASKFALRGWSEALRREWADEGVGVTYCAPRGTRTPAADGFSAYAEAFAMRLDPPEAVAARIVRGIELNARDVYPLGPERLFLLVQRLAPALVDGGIIRSLRGVASRLGFAMSQT